MGGFGSGRGGWRPNVEGTGALIPDAEGVCSPSFSRPKKEGAQGLPALGMKALSNKGLETVCQRS